MAEQHPDSRPDTGAKIDPDSSPKTGGAGKLTAFGEPLWVDTLKTLGVGLVLLLLVFVVGGALGIAIIAPWGRASHDCSIYCVLERQFDAYFADKPPRAG